MNKYWIALFSMWVVLAGCSDSSGGDTGGNGTPDDMFDRGAMLVNWADNLIIPSYESFLQQQGAFEASFETFSADPTAENLQALKQAWRNAYLSWQRVSLYEIGPAETVGLRLNINTYPTDVVLVESYATGASYDLSLPSNRDAKGFPALDYLFNGMGADEAEILARFQANAGYMNYARDVIGDITASVSGVLAQWKNGYRDTFVASDGSSATASVDRYVNDYIYYFERFLRAGKMGIPLGVFTGTTAPATIEAYYTPDLSNDLFLAALGAVQDFFNGRHFGGTGSGPSLASYLRDLNTLKDGTALDDRINAQFNTARTLVTGLDWFRSEIEENTPPTEMLLAYDQVQALVPLLKVDMVSAMSIAIDFVDADGD